MKKLIYSLALAALTSTGVSQAAILSLTQTTPGYNNGTVNPWAFDFSFAGFQTAVGAGFTLNSVTITIDPIFNASSVVYDNTLSPSSGSFSESITRVIRVVNSGNVAMNPFQVNSVACVTNGTVAASSTNTQNCAVDDPAASAVAGILAGWNVAGNVVLRASGSFNRTGSVNDVDVINNNLFSAVSVTVTYDYSPAGIPEPSTLALAGSVLVGFGVMARRKKSA
jgi:hypothetical protein